MRLAVAATGRRPTWRKSKIRAARPAVLPRRTKAKSDPGGAAWMTLSGRLRRDERAYSGLAPSRAASFSRMRADLPERPRR
jgi:hypothetical protein